MSVYKKIDSLRERYYQSARNKDSLLKLISEAEVPEQVYNSNAIENSTLSLEETEKILLQEQNQSELELFINENCFFIPGQVVKFSTLYDNFIKWLDPAEAYNWSKHKFGRSIPFASSGLPPI